MADRPYEDIRVEGHLIDSMIMSGILDDVMDLDGEFEILEFDVGRTKTDPSSAVLRLFGRDREHLAQLLGAAQEHGAVPVAPEDAALAPAPADGVLPKGFYATTNLETYVRLEGTWVPVACPEMDCGIVVVPAPPDREGTSGAGQRRVSAAAPEAAPLVRTVPVADAKAGDLIVVGRAGVRVVPLARPRERQPFEFMASAVSSEKPKARIVREVARILAAAKDARKTVIAVAGPAIVHTGAAEHLAELVRMGYVTVLFGGNAIAVHDIEAALYGTSLGLSLKEGVPVPGGHEHHLRAINDIRACGGIAEAVRQGVLTSGLMHACVESGVPFVLAGSIRDDGPLPDVITDAVEAQRAMRAHCRGAGACLMLSTMLHSVAVGNLLPASVHTVCVDINPAVVTKLADRGSFQTLGVVTDVGLFLEQLVAELGG